MKPAVKFAGCGEQVIQITVGTDKSLNRRGIEVREDFYGFG